MKLFPVLLAFFLLVLSILPCRDGIDACAEEATPTAFHQPEHQEHEQHADACSPFCACACCSIQSMKAPFIVATAAPLYAIIVYASTFVPDVSEMPLPIWQPPRLTA
ncbi:hypothetical protein MKQ68_10005 [Chitinophaga horti]|uniref:DUF2946 domain-containing protein n=1 Tax=Chitinophaga horti TaxID=2920382 RepID=A0ABY6J7X9_9BACT|nr:DUF6660 family protein [Chitinophaga horti]UYQ95431.1 hypothetical protein MKQ68_10005 [Chitinophaga horti]